MVKAPLFLTLVLMILPSRLVAGISEQVPVGPRAIALGGAFSAIADDASASFWNPAGLPFLGHNELGGTHARLFGTDLVDNYLSFAVPISTARALALDWYHAGSGESGLDFGDNRFQLSYGNILTPWLSAGISFKYLIRQTSIDDALILDGKGAGVDMGILVRPASRLRLGFVGRDLLHTRLHYSAGDESETVYERQLRVGAAYAFLPQATASVDVDDRLHAGLEVTPLRELALRAGFQEDFSDDLPATFAFGAGLRIGMLRFDLAHEIHPVLEATTHFGVGMAFSFNPSRVRIENVTTEDLYASQYKSYAHEPFGTVTVRNLHDEPLTARVSMAIQGVTEEAPIREITLRPKTAEVIPLTAVFPDRALERLEDTPVQIRVSASYQSTRVIRTDRDAGSSMLYAPGAIDWSRGVDQAAAFVTVDDPVIDALARQAIHVTSRTGSGPLRNRNIDLSAAIVNALGAHGITYITDPNNPFSVMSETPHAVDTIRYPRETLTRHAGDCDDMTVLTASLLENVGLTTRLVDVPGHVFLMFDAGLDERNRSALGIDPELYALIEGRVWIPLETTRMNDGFAAAWEAGARNMANWSRHADYRTVEVWKAQTRYESAVPPGPPSIQPDVEPELLRRLSNRDVETMSGWREAYLTREFGPDTTRKALPAAALTGLARIHVLSGDFSQALGLLEQARGREPSAAGHNNLGVTLVAAGQLERAAAHFDSALALDQSDPGIHLNAGLIRHLMGDEPGSAAALSTALSLSGGYDEVSQLLGLPGDEGTREGRVRLAIEKVKSLLKEALKNAGSVAASEARAQNPDSKNAGRTDKPAAPSDSLQSLAPVLSQPVPPMKRVLAMGRADEGVEIQEIFYWKE
jgi:tetratricopeptide (TPR) repeat protein/transglutaminase-like putative cysteine protease